MLETACAIGGIGDIVRGTLTCDGDGVRGMLTCDGEIVRGTATPGCELDGGSATPVPIIVIAACEREGVTSGAGVRPEPPENGSGGRSAARGALLRFSLACHAAASAAGALYCARSGRSTISWVCALSSSSIASLIVVSL